MLLPVGRPPPPVFSGKEAWEGASISAVPTGGCQCQWQRALLWPVCLCSSIHSSGGLSRKKLTGEVEAIIFVISSSFPPRAGETERVRRSNSHPSVIASLGKEMGCIYERIRPVVVCFLSSHPIPFPRYHHRSRLRVSFLFRARPRLRDKQPHEMGSRSVTPR